MPSPASEDKPAPTDKSTSLPNNGDGDEPRQSSTPNPCVEDNQPTTGDSLKAASYDHLNPENSSNSSVDSSWSKLSEEDIKLNGTKSGKAELAFH